MDVRMHVTGDKNINQVLRGLKFHVNHRVHQDAGVRAAKVLVTAAKLSAPEGPTGKLIDSIGTVRTPLAKAGALGETKTGPRRRGRYKGQAGHLVEYGTGPRRLKSNGANRGVMPANPFMHKAWAQVKSIVIQSYGAHLSRSVVLYLRRTLKRG